MVQCVDYVWRARQEPWQHSDRPPSTTWLTSSRRSWWINARDLSPRSAATLGTIDASEPLRASVARSRKSFEQQFTPLTSLDFAWVQGIPNPSLELPNDFATLRSTGRSLTNQSQAHYMHAICTSFLRTLTLCSTCARTSWSTLSAQSVWGVGAKKLSKQIGVWWIQN